MIRFVLPAMLCLLPCCLAARKPTFASDTPENSLRFQRIVLSEEFHSEGAAVADINRDGHNDIVSGPFWYEGPEFRARHAYAEVKPYAIGQYSDHFFTFAHDWNSDGWIDLLSIPIPGRPAVWYQNPGQENGRVELPWSKHLVLSDVGNESPTLTNLVGDESPELVCLHGGRYGYAQPQASDPTLPWRFTPISNDNGRSPFTHGMGVGDVNGDGLPDLLEKGGWWQQPDSLGQPFLFHPVAFAESGGSQMHVLDVDGDGDNDVVSVQNAHAYGLSWFERRGKGEDFLFVRHDILGDQPEDNEYGLCMTQMHALSTADIDGDGKLDLITGKRFWAHGGADPGAQELPALYWFQTVQDDSGTRFVPHLIDRRVGVGTQLATGDVNQDGKEDLVVGNKLGTFLLLNQGPQDPIPAPTRQSEPLPIVGKDEFKTAVRTTKPLTPDQELESFVLPAGFQAELVASEPQIAKPLNLAFDADGRLWVSSSVEYPFPAKNDAGRDTIQVFEDTDGDGSYDKATTFADNLNIPIGLYPHGDGVICYSIPNIWFLHDTDGDGTADEREVLYGPFDYSRDTHGMINSMRRGYDGWLYACHGFNNRSTVSGKDGNAVQMNSGNTFRMRLDGSRVEHFTHGQVNPFGLAFDPDGDLFSADCHTKPITLLMRNGQYEGFGRPHDGLGFVPNVMDHLHGSTAIAGIALYHDDQFPAIYRGNTFGGNVMTSRINRNSLHTWGSTIQAREEPDFLISGDPWFRPVDLAVAPDGALYVADFYNRIIGHYEVPLQHPGRDRHRGRIWKISFRDAGQRRDVSNPSERVSISKERSPATTIGQMSSSNLTTRMLATDAAVDQWGDRAVEGLKENFANQPGISRVHTLWALSRLDSITDSELETALNDDDDRVRTHVMKVIAERSGEAFPWAEWIDQGLSDQNAKVRRAAAMAASKHPNIDRIPLLIQLLRDTDPKDVHLRHAIRMALRDHLSKENWFQVASSGFEESAFPIILDVCPAIPTETSGNFLAKHMFQNEDLPNQRLSEYFVHVARYAKEDRLPTVTEQIERRFADDTEKQLTLLRSLRDGLAQRGIRSSKIVERWAENLVRRFVSQENAGSASIWEEQSIGWTFYPSTIHPNQASPWRQSVRRSSSDGQRGSRLWSSFPAGESKTGVFRSDPFVLPAEFSFYLAGHDGFPDQPPKQQNFVRLRDAKTYEILQRWLAPRNDTAQRIRFATQQDAGRLVQLELVDGIDLNAYAWIAAGRFSNEKLNPSPIAGERIKVAKLIAEFQLTSFLQDLRRSLSRFTDNHDVLCQEAEALVALKPSGLRSCLVNCLSVRGTTRRQRKTIVQAILDPVEDSGAILAETAKVATASEQRQMAESLVSDSQGAEVLIHLVESGHVSAQTLLGTTVSPRLNQLANPSQAKRVEQILRGLPDPTPALDKELLARKRWFLDQPGSVQEGKSLFTKHCGVCHQVGGQGVAVGPNLDGIGNRGLERLLEDVLLPNRNVDAAFKASLLLDEDGRVLTGLVKRKEGAQLVIVDQQGKTLNLPIDSIVEQKQLNSSPMPSNFHETLRREETSDLMAYLLQLTR